MSASDTEPVPGTRDGRARFRRSLEQAVSAVEIGDDGGIRWLGQAVGGPVEVPAELVAEARRTYVAELLYGSYYVYGGPHDAIGRAAAPPVLSSSADLVRTLVDSNRGRGSWSLRGSAAGDGVVDIWGVLFATGATPAVEGTRLPGVLACRSPGHITFLGDEGPLRDDAARVVRLYWNVTRAGAAALVSGVTAALNAVPVPFQFKIAYADRPWTDRADVAVLYLDAEDLRAAWPDLRNLHEQMSGWLRPYVPALTRPLGLGLGMADDPADGNSFGTHVAGLIADGVVHAYERDAGASADVRIRAVAATFEQAGRSLAAPYLNPRATDVVLPGRVRVRSDPVRATHAEPAGWLDRAARIGHDIGREALWAGGRCTWLVPVPGDGADITSEPAGADLYAGTAGLALFFGELFRQTDDRDHRDLAYGAARHALTSARMLPDLGLHAGSAGAGLAVALAADALDDEALQHRGWALACAAAGRSLAASTVESCDIVYGASGSVIALVRAHAMGCEGALGPAIELGDRLRDLAEHGAAGVSWPAKDTGTGGAGLTGLAHGAAGCSWALSELAATTGETRFLEAAEEAREFEASRYDPESGNWPDVRTAHERGPGRAYSPRESWNRFDWCYGAPGIALARLSLVRVGGSQAARDDLGKAVSATRAAAAAFPRYGYDIHLCHGAAALAEVLSTIPEPWAAAPDRELRQRLLLISVDAYRDSDQVAASPGLMLGAAGIGLAALRMAGPAAVSPLLLSTASRHSPIGVAPIERTSSDDNR